MQGIIRGLLFWFALLAADTSLAQVVPGGGYPNKPVRVIVPFPPGGPTDITARLIVQYLSVRLGKQFYVENVGGAGGNTGVAMAARAAPDGHTMLVVSSGFVVNP